MLSNFLLLLIEQQVVLISHRVANLKILNLTFLWKIPGIEHNIVMKQKCVSVSRICCPSSTHASGNFEGSESKFIDLNHEMWNDYPEKSNGVLKVLWLQIYVSNVYLRLLYSGNISPWWPCFKKKKSIIMLSYRSMIDRERTWGPILEGQRLTL